MSPRLVGKTSAEGRRSAEGRLKVGSLADPERIGRIANAGKCPFTGEKLEAATGVEPVMEVLQTSDGGDLQ